VAFRRLVAVAASREQDRKLVAFIPRKRFGNDVACCQLLLGTCHCNHRGHRLEHFVAKHEMVKESCGCMPTAKPARAFISTSIGSRSLDQRAESFPAHARGFLDDGKSVVRTALAREQFRPQRGQSPTRTARSSYRSPVVAVEKATNGLNWPLSDPKTNALRSRTIVIGARSDLFPAGRSLRSCS
jgi:hypothetical protein